MNKELKDIIEKLQTEYFYTYEEAIEYVKEWETLFKKELKEQETIL